MYRRSRRGRKTWYRQPRFLNRSKPKGWIAPSLQNKLDAHVKVIDAVKKILPITRVVVEVAAFDIQKIKNPEIQVKVSELYPNIALPYDSRKHTIIHSMVDNPEVPFAKFPSTHYPRNRVTTE